MFIALIATPLSDDIAAFLWQCLDRMLWPLSWSLQFAEGSWYSMSFEMTLLVIAITCAFIGARFLTKGAMAILLFVIVSAALFHERQFGRWRFDVLDVGHGLAVLIEKEGEVLLYDTGKAWDKGSIAQQVVSPVLHRRGFRSIDVLIVSHADSDHAGGRDYIEQHFSPKQNSAVSNTLITNRVLQESNGFGRRLNLKCCGRLSR